MSSRTEKEKLRQVQDKCQVILGQLLREEDNKYCVDCDAKGPRWASWNLGIFLCIRCAGIHRNLGVHISKVKSVNLDTWTPEQVGYLQQMGNSKARAVYEANLPDNFRRPQTDSSLEAFVRAKYEQKKYIAKEWVPPTSPKPAFDIEEEHRREKEKKRSRGGKGNVEIFPSALPRPHAGNVTHSAHESPALTSSKTAAVNENTEKPLSSSVDLLGIDISSSSVSNDLTTSDEDPFNAFISATPAPVAGNGTIEHKESDSLQGDSLSSLSDLSEGLKKTPLSKESILSLYSNGGGNKTAQPTHFGMPGGMYMQQGFQQMPSNPVPPSSNPLIGGASWAVNKGLAMGGTQPLRMEGMLPQALSNQTNQSTKESLKASNPFLDSSLVSSINPTSLIQVQQHMANLQISGGFQGMNPQMGGAWAPSVIPQTNLMSGIPGNGPPLYFNANGQSASMVPGLLQGQNPMGSGASFVPGLGGFNTSPMMGSAAMNPVNNAAMGPFGNVLPQGQTLANNLWQ